MMEMIEMSMMSYGGKLSKEQLVTMEKYPLMLYLWLGFQFILSGLGFMALLMLMGVFVCFVGVVLTIISTLI